jgi:hypothetical protein
MNMVVKVIDRCFLVVYGAAAPTNEEWRAYLQLVTNHGVNRTMQLVYTDGGVPTYAQRRYLYERLAGREVPVAVVTGNAQVRVAVTVMGWFQRGLKVFTPAELEEAAAYLEIPCSRVDLFGCELDKLRRELAG